MNIRTATEADWQEVRQLLRAVDLHADDVGAAPLPAQTILIVREGSRLVATGVLERHGAIGLLRSLAVVPSLRGGGVGRAMVAAIQRHAIAHGIGTLYLLTEAATGFFEKLGYVAVDRVTAPSVLQSSRQFRHQCPVSATLMTKTMDHPAYNVLFLCTGNSARSIIAEALINHVPGHAGKFRGYSAGSQPKGTVHPMALEVLQAAGLPTEDLTSKHWDAFAGDTAPQMDFIFTVCDSAARETCPVWPGHPATAHWGLPDPAAVVGDAETQRRAFHEALLTLRRRIDLFAELPLRALDRMSLQHAVTTMAKA